MGFVPRSWLSGLTQVVAPCCVCPVLHHPPPPPQGGLVGRVCAWSLGEGMTQHSSRPLGILTAPALIKCGRLPGNPGAGGDFFPTYFTKKSSISSWLTTREGVGDKLGSASRLSPFFFPIPACILISAHSSALIYHLKVEAGEFDSQIKSRGGFVTENMLLFTLVRVTSFVSQTCGLFHPIVCSDAPLCWFFFFFLLKKNYFNWRIDLVLREESTWSLQASVDCAFSCWRRPPTAPSPNLEREQSVSVLQNHGLWSFAALSHAGCHQILIFFLHRNHSVMLCKGRISKFVHDTYIYVL